MITPREKKHLHQIIAFCFVMNFVLGIMPGFFSDINTANASMTAKYFWQIANLFYMVGCCLYSLKAGSEDKIITAGGFIVLSIGIGTLFALQTASFSEEVTKAYAAGILAYLPGMILICYYDRLPAWLRIAGVVACIPRLITLILILTDKFEWTKHQKIDGLGYVLTNLVALGWAWFVIKPMKKFREQNV